LAHLVSQLKTEWSKYRETEMKGENSTEKITNLILPLTRDAESATPILISGIERRCRVKTDSNEEEGRPFGLYGNNFARAGVEAIEKATEVIDPPTVTNLICMAALAHGRGGYTEEQISDLFITAYTSFKAAVIESIRMINDGKLGENVPKVTIHTGNWGTGAFGGSKSLMAIIQKAAAICAGVNKFVYHTFNDEGTKGYNEGSDIFDEELNRQPLILEQLINNLEKRAFLWGMSDGN